MRILLADDDSSVRRVLQYKLQKRGYEVTAVSDGREALEALKTNRYDLVLSDIRMPELDGLALLKELRLVQPQAKVILITAHATVSQAVQAVKLGAFDYITKPFEDEELFVTIEKALAFGKLESENRRLRNRLQHSRRENAPVGVSEAFRRMMATVEKIAASDATVLITGESGTGKELVARTIHRLSTRRDHEFIAINCAAIPRELLESELFGHVRGAFTGAVRDKKGRFEQADGGTLLLDEIGDLAIELQAKLLRVLQEQVIEPVGSERRIEIDVRVLASTNVDLAKRVAEGKFREDLYYRLNVVPIHVPPLRERREDIPLLVRDFLGRFAPDEEITVEPALMDALVQHPWPGNVRQLENLIERMVVLRRSTTLTLDDLPEGFNAPPVAPSGDDPTGVAPLRETERRLIIQALEQSGWNKTRAAKLLSIPRHVLIYRLKKYGIEQPR